MKKEEKWIVIGVPVLFVIGAAFHYLYNLCGENIVIGAFHIELNIIDILILFVVLLIAHLLGLHIYRHANGVSVWICIAAFASVVNIFIVCTFFTSHIAMFWDTVHGGYGIR